MVFFVVIFPFGPYVYLTSCHLSKKDSKFKVIYFIELGINKVSRRVTWNFIPFVFFYAHIYAKNHQENS